MIILIVLSILLSKLVTTTIAATTSQNTTSFVYDFRCNGTVNPNSLYQYALFNVLGQLTQRAPKSGSYYATYGDSPNKAFGLFLCRGDMSSDKCSFCVNTAKTKILQKCPYQTVASIWYDHCMIRFSNQSFYGRMYVLPRLKLKSTQNVTTNEVSRFAELLNKTMSVLAVQAADDKVQNRKWASTKVDFNFTNFRTFYGLAQCTPDLSQYDCVNCLNVAIGQLAIATGAWLLQPSCCLRYENYSFLDPMPISTQGDNSQDRLTGRRHHSTQHALVGIPISIAIVLGVVGVLIYLRKKKAAQSAYAEINEIKTVESLQFDLSTIKAATNNFSPENRLGEGGFGEVYKGILENGQEVAIKRLSKNSGQGIEEFKTEVDLVAKLQHKNLVKLLGYCLSSTEKILVYEFLRNSSLDRFLFDRTNESLDWETRFKLIIGVARGLLYLHEDSRFKVIHRDLKPSNILLDESMNPKISDFGLAKLFGVDQTQDDTKRIVGTYGYMAPEYAMTGHFSVRSDVYSFGIIMLEIISGQRNNFFGRHPIEEALLHRAWRLWNEGKSLNLVDTVLANKYPEENVERCIHIALMCIQENATERPRMATVIAALNEKSIGLPMPKAPSFFGNTNTTNKETSSSHSAALIGDDRQETITELHPR